MITEKDLQEKLRVELVGKEYDAWGTDGAVLRTIRNVLDENRISTTDTWSDHDGQTIFVKYKRHGLCEVKVTKQKGKYHSSYWGRGHYYDWTIKDISVSIYTYGEYAPTIEDRIKAINAEIENETKAKMNKDEQAVELLKLVMKHFNLKYYDASSLCKYASDHDWGLRDQVLEGKDAY